MIKVELMESETRGRVMTECDGSVYTLAIELNAIIKHLAESEPGQVVINSVFAHNIDRVNSRNVIKTHKDHILAMTRRLEEID